MRSAFAFVAAATLLFAAAPAAAFMPQFLQSIARDGPKLTEEQAKMASGVWVHSRGIRLDSSSFSELFMEAVMEANATGLPIDYDAVMASAPTVDTLNSVFKLWIPAVNASSGLFGAWYVLSPPGKPATVSRLIGMAVGQEDGSVLLGATKDEDTALWTGLISADTPGTMVGTHFEGVEKWNADRTKLEDNQNAAYYTYDKATAPEEEEVALAEVVAAVQAGRTSHTARVAAADRAELDDDLKETDGELTEDA